MSRFYQELETYSKTDFYPFHMPGHKRNPASVDVNLPFDRDITEIHGFDNLHHAEEILKEAQQQVAQVYGSIESFYSVNGSTAALLAAVSAAVPKGGKILVARNCHKAVYHALYLRDLLPVYLYPQIESKFGINGGILPEDVDNSLKKDPDIAAVLLTSPTYDGVVSDVKCIAEIAYKHEVPLIVDEAHGAHFAFSSYFPKSAVQSGADLVIQSLHKTLPAMTQTAVLHRCTDRIDREKLIRFMGIYQTSSPSYILMESMDACMEKLQREGEEMFRSYVDLLFEARERLRGLKHLKLITEDIKGSAAIYDYDRSKILISTIGTEITGKELHERLRTRYHLELEMDADSYVTALTSVGDRREGFLRLCRALLEIDETLSLKKKETTVANPCMPLEQVMRISDAMDAELAQVPFLESEGQISGEFAYFYPPGIPVLVPGERITGQFLKNVRRYIQQGYVLQGLCDYQNQSILIVKKT
jgi:arginine/lysine/ornithine decarboxylase